MRRSVACLLAVFAAGLFVPSARGDLAPPVPKPKKLAIKVEIDENAKESRLLIPQGAVFNRPARPFPAPKAVPPKGELPKAELPGDDDAIAEAPAPTNNLQLVFVGAALALGLTFGGLWLTRRRPSSRNLAVVLAVGAALTAGGVVLANRAPPPQPKPQPSNLTIALEGEIQFEVVPGAAGPVRLVLTKADYEKLKEKPAKTR